MEEQKTLLHFNPSQPCVSCERFTNLGAYEASYPYESQGYTYKSTPTLYPYCPVHNYSEAYPEDEQHRCIRRFVSDQLGNGRIRDITRLPDITKDSPGESGYTKEDDWRDYCWRLTFQSRAAGEIRVYVVYSINDLQFYLLRPGLEQASL